MAMTAVKDKRVWKLSPQFGPWLRRAREQIPMTLKDFSRRTGIGPTTVTAFELNQRLDADVGVDQFVRIAQGLNMDLGYVLHKAGLDLGPDGISLGKLRRVEQVAEAFATYESDLRVALADAITEFAKPDRGDDRMILGLSRGLAALDRVTERLRREGFVAGRQPGDPMEAARRPWNDADRRFLIENPKLPLAEQAAHLGRTEDAVRAYVHELNGGSE